MEPCRCLHAEGLTKTVGSGRGAPARARRRQPRRRAGEVVAVLGRSGSGKSTLLHLLGGLDSPDQGEITLAGERLTGRSSRALARIRLRHVGFVFQQFQLIEELSGAENVLLATRLPGAPAGGARRAAELIDELGLAASPTTCRTSSPAASSSGSRSPARSSTIRELVLADEPTGSLDAESGAAVLELLRGLRGPRGRDRHARAGRGGDRRPRPAPRTDGRLLAARRRAGLGSDACGTGRSAALTEARQRAARRRRRRADRARDRAGGGDAGGGAGRRRRARHRL